MSDLKDIEGVPLFAGVNKARFRKPVVPGDQLIVEVNIIQSIGNMVKVNSKALVDGEVVAQAELLFALGKSS